MIRSLIGVLAGLGLWLLVTQFDAADRERAARWIDHQIREPVARVDPFAMKRHFDQRRQDCTYGTREKWFLGCNKRVDPRPFDIERCRRPDGSLRLPCDQPSAVEPLRPLLGVPDALISTLWMLGTSGWLPALLVGVPSLAVLLLLLAAWTKQREQNPLVLANPAVWGLYFLLCGLMSWVVQAIVFFLILIVHGVLWAAVLAGVLFTLWSQVKEPVEFASFFRRRVAGPDRGNQDPA